MNTATLVQVMVDNEVQQASLYKLSPAFEGHEYVIVSAVDVLYSGPETFIFPSNAEGYFVELLEMYGSFRGEKNHRKALDYAGFTLVEPTCTAPELSLAS